MNHALLLTKVTFPAPRSLACCPPHRCFPGTSQLTTTTPHPAMCEWNWAERGCRACTHACSCATCAPHSTCSSMQFKPLTCNPALAMPHAPHLQPHPTHTPCPSPAAPRWPCRHPPPPDPSRPCPAPRPPSHPIAPHRPPSPPHPFHTHARNCTDTHCWRTVTVLEPYIVQLMWETQLPKNSHPVIA